jgi:hypothetical protein
VINNTALELVDPARSSWSPKIDQIAKTWTRGTRWISLYWTLGRLLIRFRTVSERLEVVIEEFRAKVASLPWTQMESW